MAFNHYAKMKRILDAYPGWHVIRVNEPTSSLSFKGERRDFDHYYRVCTSDGEYIKYCKFQQLDRFAQAMNLDVDSIPLIEQ